VRMHNSLHSTNTNRIRIRVLRFAFSLVFLVQPHVPWSCLVVKWRSVGQVIRFLLQAEPDAEPQGVRILDTLPFIGRESAEMRPSIS